MAKGGRTKKRPAVDPPSASQEEKTHSNLSNSDIGFSVNHRPVMNRYQNTDWEDGAFGMNPPSYDQNLEDAWAFHDKKHDINQRTNGPFLRYPDPPRTPPSVLANRHVQFAEGTRTNSPIMFNIPINQNSAQSNTSNSTPAPQAQQPPPMFASPSPQQMKTTTTSNRLSISTSKRAQRKKKSSNTIDLLLEDKEKERMNRTNAANARNPINITKSKSSDSTDGSSDNVLAYDSKADDEDFESMPTNSSKKSTKKSHSNSTQSSSPIRTRGSSGISVPSSKKRESEGTREAQTGKKKKTKKNDPLGDAHPTIAGLREATQSTKCCGCNKTAKECNEVLFGGFAFQECKHYINEKGVGATYKAIEDVFFKAYNTSFRYYMWAKHRKSICPTTEIEPTACVWNASFVKAMQYHSDNFLEIVKTRVEERVLVRDYDWEK